ncbi:hypothetical protein B0T20DRAFT_397886 [Sordaria brevicollis]|uniref:Uncharacterized protein n=1 Tax=Sordaria brevicollis TaxID=83679 RepID=A0AAE0U2A4_SORBR|nr:hypothetical protein B0T20DRAFT_397886 [Sordaria brevicollis]
MADNRYVQLLDYLPGLSILGFFLFAFLALYVDYTLTSYFLSDAAKEAEKKRKEEDKKKRLEQAEKSRQEQIRKREEENKKREAADMARREKRQRTEAAKGN